MLSSKRKPPGRSTIKPENSNARRELGARLLKITTTCLQNAHRPDQFRCAIALISTNCSGEASPVTPISEPAGR